MLQLEIGPVFGFQGLLNGSQECSMICIAIACVKRPEPWNSNRKCRRGEVECMMGMKDNWMVRMKKAMP